MKDSIWGYLVIMFGIIAIIFIFFMQRVTTSDQHNYTLLRETAEAAMYDALDMERYNNEGNTEGESSGIAIDREKFIESFMRRFADNASLSRTYKIEIYDINEEPPKVSIKVSSAEGNEYFGNITFDLTNKVDAILESKYWEGIKWKS